MVTLFPFEMSMTFTTLFKLCKILQNMFVRPIKKIIQRDRCNMPHLPLGEQAGQTETLRAKRAPMFDRELELQLMSHLILWDLMSVSSNEPKQRNKVIFKASY